MGLPANVAEELKLLQQLAKTPEISAILAMAVKADSTLAAFKRQLEAYGAVQSTPPAAGNRARASAS